MLISALLPLIRLLQITLLNPFAITSHKCSISKRYNAGSLAAIVTFILLTIHGIVEPNFYINSNNSIGSTTVLLKLCGVRFGHIVILVESYVQRRELIEVLNVLSSVDATLVEQLGIDVGHKKLRSFIITSLSVIFTIFVIIEATVLFINVNHSSVSFVVFWLARLISFSVISLRYIQVIFTIYIIQSRLTLINLNLTKLYNEDFEVSHTRFASVIGLLQEDNRNVFKSQQKILTSLDKIPIFRDLLGKLWEASNLVNKCFGVSLLACIGNDFGVVILNGYWMYINYKQSQNLISIFGTAIWSLPHLGCLMFIAGICYSTVLKANETALIIHKFNHNSVDGRHTHIDLLFEQFSLQLLHQKPTFNACGFFIIDFTLIFTIIGAVTTYLVILIQFQMST